MTNLPIGVGAAPDDGTGDALRTAFRKLNISGRVISATTTAQPGSPTADDLYIVPASATGADWAGEDDNVAWYDGAGWVFFTPFEGLQMWAQDTRQAFVFTNSAWDNNAIGGGLEVRSDGVVVLASANILDILSGSVSEDGGVVTLDLGDGSDPNYPNTRILLKGEGADASTTILDSGPNSEPVTAVGDAQIDTGQFKFGTSSILFDGSGDHLEITNSEAWNLNDDEWQFDFQVRFNNIASGRSFATKWGASGSQSWAFVWLTSNNLQFTYTTDGNSDQNTTFAFTPVVNQWYHILVSKDSSDQLRVFVDGTQVGSTLDLSGVTIFNNSDDVWIGAQEGFGGAINNPMDGWIDEFRLLNKAVETSNFTAPTVEYATNSPSVPDGFKSERKTSVQAITASTDTDVIFNSESFDSENVYDIATGIFTIPGSLNNKQMNFTATVLFDTDEDATVKIMQGTKVIAKQKVTSSDSINLSSGNVVVSTGEEIKVVVNTATAANIIGTNDDETSSFGGYTL